MSELLKSIEGAMRADAEAVRIIGQNIANAEMTAYQRQIPLSAPTFADALERTQAETAAATVAIDFQAGGLRSTGEALHFALDGPGFFTIGGADGIRLTRRGDFQISSNGLLVTAAGEAVLGENGPIQLSEGIPEVDADGTVRIGQQVVDRLRIVDVVSQHDLQYRGDGTFQPSSAQELRDSSASVRQRYLETSNVSSVGEMVRLMETVRHFEATQRFARGYDDLMQQAIRDLGKVG